jgi:hypothetical protein
VLLDPVCGIARARHRNVMWRQRHPLIGRRLRQRPARRRRVWAGACVSTGLLDDRPHLRFREPLHRDSVRIDLVPDVKRADAVALGDEGYPARKMPGCIRASIAIVDRNFERESTREHGSASSRG